MWVWYTYELGRCTSNIILVSPGRFLYFIKFKRIVSWVLGKELIKVKSEVAKLLIFHSGMGCSEFNYPAAEVLPSMWWHLLKSANGGVHVELLRNERLCMSHQVGPGRVCQGDTPVPCGAPHPCPARSSTQCRSLVWTSLKSSGQAFHMLPLLWDSPDLELVNHYYWVTWKNVPHALLHPAFW